MQKKMVLLFIFIVSFSVLSGCVSNKPVKVAIMTKLEAGSIIGSSEVDGVRMFLKEKGITNVELVPFNDGWDPTMIKAAYEEVRAQGINIIITSHTSTCALELKKLTDLEQDKVLVFVTGSTTNLLSNLDDNNIRVVQDVASEQTSIAKEIQSHNYKHLLIVRDLDNNKYTEPALEFFKKNYSGKVTLIDISIKNLDMSQLKNDIKDLNYDAVYTLIGGNQTSSGSIAQLAWVINPNITVYFTPWNNASTVLETAGKAIDVCIMANHYPPKNNQPGVKAYFDHFKATYNYAPTYNSLHVYRAMSVLSSAINANKTTPTQIKAYLIKQKTADTDFGSLEINAFGDVDMPLYFIDNIKDAF